MRDVIERYKAIVIDFSLDEELREDGGRRSKAVIKLVDHSRLDAYEGVFPYPSGTYRRYSFHWASAERILIIRWDNAPHHPHLENAPYHRHKGELIESSPEMTLDAVLQEIQRIILREDEEG